MKNYNITKEKIEKVIDELKERIPIKRIVVDEDILQGYSVDETSDLFAMPNILVRAESVEEVSIIMQICTRNGFPIVPRGAGTGVTGGAVPVVGGLVLSLERMNKIIEIDKENMIAIVEPGVITGDIQRAVLKVGLKYPPDPASLDSCSIGGNVAEIAGGPSAVKYGITKDYILGLEFVLPDGSIINTGGKIVKNSTGYNLVGILLGSEGTLAVITKIYLRLIPAPEITKDLLIPFDSLDSAMDAVYNILSSRIVPATIEFMEKDAITLVSKFLNNEIPFPDAGAHLLIQIDGNDDDMIINEMSKIADVVDVDPEKIIVAESAAQKERLWKARRSIRESIHAESSVFLAEDTVVPRSEISEFLKSLKSYFKKEGLDSVIFGHAGDGNVHVDILKGDIDYGTWKGMLPGLKSEIYKRALSHGGTISGEHGIGYIRKDYLPLVMSDAEIELQKRIKKAFDPDGILNPEKIFN